MSVCPSAFDPSALHRCLKRHGISRLPDVEGDKPKRQKFKRYGLTSAFLFELILTAGFLVVILGATAPGAHAMAAPIAIGLALTLIHLVSIPVTNTSVNPARSTGVALFAEGSALAQLWLFWLAPLIGGAVGAVVWKVLAGQTPAVASGREPA